MDIRNTQQIIANFVAQASAGKAELRVGDVLRAVVEKVESNNQAVLRIGEQTLKIKNADGLTAGQRLLLDVIQKDSLPQLQIRAPSKAFASTPTSTALQALLPRQQPLQSLLPSIFAAGNQFSPKGPLASLRQYLDGMHAALANVQQVGTQKGLKRALAYMAQAASGSANQHAELGYSFKADLQQLAIKTLQSLLGAKGAVGKNTGVADETLVRLLSLFVDLKAVTSPPSPQAAKGDGLNAIFSQLLGLKPAGQQSLAAKLKLQPKLLQQLNLSEDLLEDAFKLLRQLESALARLSLTQLRTNQDGQRADSATPQQLYLELPIKNADQFDLIDVLLKAPDKSKPESEREWQVSLRFKFESIGAVLVKVSLLETKIRTWMWAERETTVDLLNRHLHSLQSDFAGFGLDLEPQACCYREHLPGLGPLANSSVLHAQV